MGEEPLLAAVKEHIWLQAEKLGRKVMQGSGWESGPVAACNTQNPKIRV